MKKCYAVLPNGNRGLSENCTHAEREREREGGGAIFLLLVMDSSIITAVL